MYAGKSEEELKGKPFNYEPLRRYMWNKYISWEGLRQTCELQETTIDKLKNDEYLNIRTISKICIYYSLDISAVVEINYGYPYRYDPEIIKSKAPMEDIETPKLEHSQSLYDKQNKKEASIENAVEETPDDQLTQNDWLEIMGVYESETGGGQRTGRMPTLDYYNRHEGE